jgi:hypothetical protein
MSAESVRTVKYYHANKEHYLAKRKEYVATVKDYIRNAKSVPCADCGVQYNYWIMQFDHRPGEIKSGSVAQFQSKGMKWVQKEILKCDVVCANCHADRTYQRLSQ